MTSWGFADRVRHAEYYNDSAPDVVQTFCSGYGERHWQINELNCAVRRHADGTYDVAALASGLHQVFAGPFATKDAAFFALALLRDR